MRSLWTLKHALGALLILAAGWFIFNIWVVMAGALYAILGIRKLTMAAAPPVLRGLLFLAILAVLFGLGLYSGNHDFYLATAVYLLCGLFTPWLRTSPDGSASR